MKYVMGLILSLFLLNEPANAKDVAIGPLQISQPWLRATPKGASVAGGYMTIRNTGTGPDRLIGGSAEVAGRFEVHEMAMEQGVMKMRHLSRGLEVKPGETVELKPGGYHIMLMDLKQPLTQGQTVRGTLIFEKAGTVAVEYSVAPIGAQRSGAGMHKAH